MTNTQTFSHTKLFQHLVAFIQYKVFQVAEIELLVAHQSKNTARGANNDVRAVVLEGLFVLLNIQASEEHPHFGVGHVLAESFILLGYLVSQLSCMTHYQH